MMYSNPQTRLEVADWPFGRQTCRAVFQVETMALGQRCSRVTENKTKTGWNKPKTTTYGLACRIVTGDDGRTYVATLGRFGSICIMDGTMKTSADHVHDSDARYPEILSLLTAGGES